jgi:formiminoglutamase
VEADQSVRACQDSPMTAADGPSRPVDPRWPRASDWLAGAAVGGSDDRDGGLAFLGVPAFRTSLSPTTAHLTPAAVRAALGRFSPAAASRQVDLAELPVTDLGDLADPDDDEAATSATAAAATSTAALLVACGGDNSITYAVMRGVMGERLPTAGLVTLDAHHDLREGVSNGSPVRRLVEAGLDPARVVQVGISDWANSRSYSDEAAELGITVVPRQEVARRGIEACVREALDVAGAGGAPVYVDLDVDVCDRSVAPACPASVPGGLSAAELMSAAHLAGGDARVRAIDITEVDAGADAPDGRTVRLAALCLLEAAAGLAGR